jgi:hypothetical protein
MTGMSSEAAAWWTPAASRIRDNAAARDQVKTMFRIM